MSSFIRVDLLLVVAILVLCSCWKVEAVLVQGENVFTNVDFYPSFYPAYNITGIIHVANFGPGCTLDPSSVVAGQISIYFAESGLNNGCSPFASAVFANLLDVVGTNLPSLIIAVSSVTQSQGADQWDLSPQMQASGVIFTSIRQEVYPQLTAKKPVTVTPGTNEWQTFYFSQSTYAYYVTMAVLWSLLVFAYTLAFIDTIVTMYKGQINWTGARVYLNISGFSSSVVFMASYSSQAYFVSRLMIASTPYVASFYAFFLLPMGIGVTIISIIWIRICTETKSISVRLAQALRRFVEIIGLIATLFLLVVGIVLTFPSLPYIAYKVLFIIAFLVAACCVGLAAVIIFCFIKIWYLLHSGTNVAAKSSTSLWKLAVVSAGSIFTLLLLHTVAVSSLSSFLSQSVYTHLVLDCLKSVTPLPMLTSWLVLNTFWEKMWSSSYYKSSFSVSDSQEKRRKSAMDIELDIDPAPPLKLTYHIGDKEVEL